jgi:hypothetical protein
MMYLMRAFSLLFNKHSIAREILKLDPSLQDKVPMACLHVLARLLHIQNADGSWDGVCELTAYAVLALSSITSLPWTRQVDQASIRTSIVRGKSFLKEHRFEWARGSHLWIEKVTFASDILSEAYCLAASQTPLPLPTLDTPREQSPDPPFLVHERLLTGISKAGALMMNTALVSQLPASHLRVAELQAGFTMQLVQRQPPNVFPRLNKSKEKHIFIVPLALTTCAILHGCVVSPSVLYEMTVLSILNFQADEYMEGMVERHFGSSLDIIRTTIRQNFAGFHLQADNFVSDHYGDNAQSTNRQEKGCPAVYGEKPTVQDVSAVLGSFMARILHHEAVQSSPPYLKAKLEHDLETFLLAHIAQAEHNNSFRTQSHVHHSSNYPDSAGRKRIYGTSWTQTAGSALQYNTPGQSFYHWLHRTSADHTSCPFSFVFFNCLLHTSYQIGHPILTSARTIYLGEDVCRHLASLCRLYNDLGSAVRDTEEGAVNSLNFPEFFFREARYTVTITEQKVTPKEDLLWIAEYERQGLDMAMTELERELGSGDLLTALRIFIDVTDLYGQLYLLKDLGIRTR